MSDGNSELGEPGWPKLHGRDLKERLKQDDQYPFASGGNSNIYRGKLTCSDGRKIRVAIKMMRISDDGSGQQEKMLVRLKREANIWDQLKHKNVLPFIGLCEDFAPFPVLISPFYEFGHVGKYLSKHPGVNREELVLDVASGLQFLHDNNVVHGDLKVQNVLVDNHGVPRICDFGFSKIVSRRGFTTSNIGTAPYMAPELFFVVDINSQESSSPSTTTSSDVYSFALLVIEILTAEPPKGRPTRTIVTRKILSNLRPKRMDYDEMKVSQGTWSVLDECWSFEPHLRPTVSEVLSGLTDSFSSSMPMDALAAN
ncbi:kinase-like domain-containing protein [Mycena olivaceomarginata]|nr:kinase-like domain-containing protein [Mycena olivaceomarginata]